ncbi:Cell division protein FtsL domain-containing protein [Candidatus Magnetomoraceae bacterium gMMP-15]
MNNSKIKNQNHSETGPAWLWCILILFFVCQMLVYAWCRVQYVQTGYEIREQESRRQKIMSLQNELKIEMARLKSPDRIMRIANEQLGLVMPANEQIKIIP